MLGQADEVLKSLENATSSFLVYQKTSEAWINCMFLVMNLMVLLRELYEKLKTSLKGWSVNTREILQI